VNITLRTVRPAALHSMGSWLRRLAACAPAPIRTRLEFECLLFQAKQSVPERWHPVLESSLRLDPSGALFLKILKAVDQDLRG